ncbi:MAG: flagellin [Kineosporiaceae bacterium]|nr:flagellin [Aeromicrobium sp.]
MSLRINQNIDALNSYRNLSVTQGQMSKSLEKLSSGFRINRAADDAAGLAISEGLRSQIGGLKVAIRNTQDGVSVVQTAEGALGETHSLLQRMRDLAVQGANSGGLSTAAKENIQSEMGQLKQEITRIADTTKFNGTTLLDSKYTGVFQVGANVGETISVAITQGMNAEGLDVADVDVTLASANPTGLSAVTNTAGTAAGTPTAATASQWTATDAWVAPTAADSFTVAIDGATAKTVTLATSDNLAAAITKINTALGAQGTASDVGGKLVITSATTGADSSVTLAGTKPPAGSETTAGADSTTTPATKASYNATLDFANLSGTVTLGDKSVDLGAVLAGLATDATDTDKAAALDTALEAAFGSGTATVAGSDGKLTLTAATAGAGAFTVTGQSGANAAIKAIDNAIKTVSTVRADLGAVQNRFEHTINNLNVTVENLSASESRIRDTDMASEMMNFTRSQILAQAGTAMLAQANQAPQLVLQLLQ